MRSRSTLEHLEEASAIAAHRAEEAQRVVDLVRDACAAANEASARARQAIAALRTDIERKRARVVRLTPPGPPSNGRRRE